MPKMTRSAKLCSARKALRTARANGRSAQIIAMLRGKVKKNGGFEGRCAARKGKRKGYSCKSTKGKKGRRSHPAKARTKGKKKYPCRSK